MKLQIQQKMNKREMISKVLMTFFFALDILLGSELCALFPCM